MCARILELPVDRMRGRKERPSAPMPSLAEHAGRLYFWRGASGRSYPHTVYSLIECPPVPAANFVLVRRDGQGLTQVMRIGRVSHAAETLNLAELRRVGTTLGAQEIHLHFLAADAPEALAVELDLKAASQDAAPQTVDRKALRAGA
jgi:hypothetical protein